MILLRNTPLIAKINNSKLKIISSDKFIIKKIDVDNQEMTDKVVEMNQHLRIVKFKEFLILKMILLRNYLKLVIFLQNNDIHVVTKINTEENEITIKIEGKK